MVGRMTGSIVGGMSGPLTRRKGGFEWYPGVLYQPGDILLWYDPSDLTTMFTNTTGTTNVTADGDSVALMLDKGQWGGKTLAQVLAAATERASAATTPGNWTRGFDSVDGTFVESGDVLTYTVGAGDGAFARMCLAFTGLTVGESVKLMFAEAGGTGTGDRLIVWTSASDGTGGTALNQVVPAGWTDETKEYIVPVTATTMYMAFCFASTSAGSTAGISNISVKEIPGYHRVQATPSQAPKYKTDGTLHWLLYDGTDDGAVTPTINWGTDEVAICAGVTKSSDAAVGVIAELSASAGANNGAFVIYGPGSNGNPTFGANLRGTSETGYGVGSAFSAPTTVVYTALFDIAGAARADEIKPYINGVIYQTSGFGTSAGTGNFGNYPLYFGRRGGSSLPFNGKEHSFVARSRLFTASEEAKLEAFVALKTGVIL
jgi:hypothetical protein